MLNKKGIVLAGATGVGKTDLSIKLAKKLNAHIISADSAQVYCELDIGTAKISKSEMQGIPHHMIDIISPTHKYSVGEFQKNVDNILNDLERKNITPILVGGTGLYISSITKGLADLPQGDERIRLKYENMESSELIKILEKVDPESAKSIHPNNKKRIIRALEVWDITHKPFSYLSKQNIKNNNFDFIKILLVRDRDELYTRINRRVDMMIEQGLVSEVKRLYSKYGENLRKINIIGYSEIIDYINNKITLDTAIEEIKKNSRHYAKRQFTWFGGDSEYIIFDVGRMNEDEIINLIIKKIRSLDV